MSSRTSGYPELLTIPEVTEILRVCIRTVWRLIKNGSLESCRVGRRVSVHLRAL